MLITNEGIPLQTTVDSDTTVQVSPEIRLMMVITLNITPQYGGLVSQLSNKTRTVIKEMDKKNDLTCIRVQSTKFEVKFPSLKFGISTRCFSCWSPRMTPTFWLSSKIRKRMKSPMQRVRRDKWYWENDWCGQPDSLIISDLRQIVKLYHRKISEYLAGHRVESNKIWLERELLPQHIFVSLLRLYTITQSSNIPKMIIITHEVAFS